MGLAGTKQVAPAGGPGLHVVAWCRSSESIHVDGIEHVVALPAMVPAGWLGPEIVSPRARCFGTVALFAASRIELPEVPFRTLLGHMNDNGTRRCRYLFDL